MAATGTRWRPFSCRGRKLAASLRTLTRHRREASGNARVVHGIATGREQIEHGGNPLDDTGAIVGIHMALLLIAENNLYARDGIRIGSGTQPPGGIPFASNATADGINGDIVSTQTDRCKAV